MTSSDALDLADVNALLDRCASLIDGQAFHDGCEYAGKQAAVYGESILGEYPPRKEGVPLPLFYDLDGKQSKFKSRKQRAFVAMMGKKGKIPTVRSGLAGRSLTSAVEVESTGITIRWGSNLERTKYIWSKTEINHYLASLGWKPLQDTTDAHQVDILDRFVVAFRGYVRGYLAGKQ